VAAISVVIFSYTLYNDYCVKVKIAPKIRLVGDSPRKESSNGSSDGKLNEKDEKRSDDIDNDYILKIEDLEDFKETFNNSKTTISLDHLNPERKRRHA
jgi:hypothetical protein